MAFAHYTAEVAGIEDKTAARRKEWGGDNVHHPLPSDVLILDGIVFVKQAGEFIRSVLAKFPGAKVGVNANCSRERTNDNGSMYMYAYVEAWIYFPGHLYALGRVGRKQYMNSSKITPPYMYGVQARTIKNERFAMHHNCYNMRLASDPKVALKYATTYLRPYTTAENIDQTIDPIVNEVRKQLSTARAVVTNARDEVMNDTILQRELSLLLQTDYAFSTPGYREKVEKWLGELTSQREEARKPVHGYYVHIREVGGEQRAEVTEVYDIIHDRRKGSSAPTVLPLADLPDYISGKMAVLTMVERDTFVTDVGLRVADNVFWVMRDVA